MDVDKVTKDVDKVADEEVDKLIEEVAKVKTIAKSFLLRMF